MLLKRDETLCEGRKRGSCHRRETRWPAGKRECGERPQGQCHFKPYLLQCDQKSVDNASSRYNAKKAAEDSGKTYSGMNPGYCLNKPVGSAIGKSGITIGAGIDLGQTSEKELREYGIPEKWLAKVRTFIGPGVDQTAALAEYNARKFEDQLTTAEVAMFNSRVREALIRKVAGHYREITGQDFYKLDTYSQTAIYSVCHQNHGPSKPGKKVQELMIRISEGKIDEASATLRSIGDKDKDRRAKEAKFLELSKIGARVVP